MSGAHARQRNPPAATAEPSSGHRIFNDFLEVDCVERLLGNPLIAIKNSKRLVSAMGQKASLERFGCSALRCGKGAGSLCFQFFSPKFGR